MIRGANACKGNHLNLVVATAVCVTQMYIFNWQTIFLAVLMELPKLPMLTMRSLVNVLQ